MADRKPYQLFNPGDPATPTAPTLAFYMIVQKPDGSEEPVKLVISSLKTLLAIASADVAGLSAALSAKADLVGGKLNTSQLPSIAIVDYLGTVADETAMLSLVGQKGDWCIRSDQGKVWVIVGNTPTLLSSWKDLAYPAAGSLAWGALVGDVTTQADLMAQLNARINKEDTITQAAHGFTKMMAVRQKADGTWERSRAITTGSIAHVDGIVSAVVNANSFKIVRYVGAAIDISDMGLTADAAFYLESSASGINYTATEPNVVGNVYKLLFKTTTTGIAVVKNEPAFEIMTSPGVGGGGGATLLASGTVTAENSHDFDISTFIATYKEIKLKIYALRSNTDGDDIWVRIGPAAGTVDSGAGTYKFGYTYGSGGLIDQSDDKWVMIYGITTNAAAKKYSGEISLKKPSDNTSYTVADWKIGGMGGGANSYQHVYGGGVHTVQQAVQVIRFLAKWGNLTYDFEIWGE